MKYTAIGICQDPWPIFKLLEKNFFSSTIQLLSQMFAKIFCSKFSHLIEILILTLLLYYNCAGYKSECTVSNRIICFYFGKSTCKIHVALFFKCFHLLIYYRFALIYHICASHVSVENIFHYVYSFLKKFTVIFLSI